MIHPTSEPITGHESPIDPSIPTGALADFYRAFNQRDLGLMLSNWDVSEDVSMDNPLGGIRRGWSDIGAVYEQLFGGKAIITVEFYDYTVHRFADIFIAVGRERGTLRKETLSLGLAIRTTRIFRFVGDRWRQFHHHGSFEDAELLARYQAAVQRHPGP